ncbi:MAG TPA: biopolymer transporter ExbD, partial [Acetobacteraceae bacterium]|nr:biopolymer transporter ExbD [Acetobacteraceae bacterium]
PVDLPVARSAASAPTEPVILSVQRDLQLSVNDTPVARAQMADALRRISRGDLNTRIYLRADKNVRYGDLIDIMDLLRVAGYEKVALVSRQVP